LTDQLNISWWPYYTNECIERCDGVSSNWRYV